MTVAVLLSVFSCVAIGNAYWLTSPGSHGWVAVTFMLVQLEAIFNFLHLILFRRTLPPGVANVVLDFLIIATIAKCQLFTFSSC